MFNPVEKIYVKNIIPLDDEVDSIEDNIDSIEDNIDSIEDSLGSNLIFQHSCVLSGPILDYDTTGYITKSTYDGDKNVIRTIHNKSEYSLSKKIVPRTGGIILWHDDARLTDYSQMLPIYNKYKVHGTFNVINPGHTRVFGAGTNEEGIKRVRGFLEMGHEIGEHTLGHRTYLYYNYLDSLVSDTTSGGGHSCLFYDTNVRKTADKYAYEYLGCSLGFNDSPIDSCGGIYEGIADTTSGSTKGRANCYIWDRLMNIQQIWFQQKFGCSPTSWTLPGGSSGTWDYTSTYTDTGWVSSDWANFSGMVNPKTNESFYDILKKWGYKTVSDNFFIGRNDNQGYKHGRTSYQINAFLSHPNGLLFRPNNVHPKGSGSDLYYTQLMQLSDFQTVMYDSVFADKLLDCVCAVAQGQFFIWGYDSTGDLCEQISTEFLMKFCYDNNIPVYSLREGYQYCHENKTTEYDNVIPNPDFKQTLLDYFPNSSDPKRHFPDGWFSALYRWDYSFSGTDTPVVVTNQSPPDSISRQVQLAPSHKIMTCMRGLYPGKYQLSIYVKTDNVSDNLDFNIWKQKVSTPITQKGVQVIDSTFILSDTLWTKKTVYFYVENEVVISDSLDGGAGLVGLEGYDNKIMAMVLEITPSAGNAGNIYITMPFCRKLRTDEF